MQEAENTPKCPEGLVAYLTALGQPSGTVVVKMATSGDTRRKKTAQKGDSKPADWREPFLRFPFFQIHFAAPLGLVAFLSICYMISAVLIFRHHLSAFEAHLIILLLIFSVIYTGFLNVLHRQALGRWGFVEGTAAVWAGIFVMIIGIALFGVYLAVVAGLL